MNFFEKYNKMNEKNKIKLILIWILILIILYIIKYFVFDKKNNSKNENTKSTNNYLSEEYDTLLKKNGVDGSLNQILNDIKDEYKEFEVTDIVKNFAEYCKNKEYDEAYKLISDECKEERFPSIESFKEYISNIYTENSHYNINYEDAFDLEFKIEVYDNVIDKGKWEKNNLKEIKLQINFDYEDDRIDIIEN